ncbi:L-amino acid N-acyltransferase YncA [Faunimonas pinastri]|uniref:L-amino acid N-acyltransferase YncA n=1 Tax=Faunimonas pinastri TaxID=1855383 RepID=A0A1H9MFD3_9HYPH|nr:GNAT family N-acetyltransferase [Faunimonas pinastri]SER22392.1 L-amino acid N-acyltransferase YncA [Faunimonas pinastri]
MTALAVDFRFARASDAADLADVYAEAWREAYSGIIPSVTLQRMIAGRGAPWWRQAMKHRNVVVVEASGKVVGYATFSAARTAVQVPTAEIHELYLHPLYQGIGIGGRFFAALLKTLGARGFRRTVLRALADNDRARDFYTRRGGAVFARSDDPLGPVRLPCLWFQFPL